jgi:hypothetical protein
MKVVSSNGEFGADISGTLGDRPLNSMIWEQVK